jgi:adenylosuccinate lyase
MKTNLTPINYDVAEKKEREVRHDVMAHIHAYGAQCPKAMPIIHLGATSCYVGDNSDIIIFRDALNLIGNKIVNVIDKLAAFALKYKALPTLGFTHLQPAQPVTVGKRATLWIQDLLMDMTELSGLYAQLKMRGVKGTTGTQASFLRLFDGDYSKVKQLNKLVASKMGFKDYFAVSGQTYPRKLDSMILKFLSSVAESAYKFSNDIRLLQNMKEIEEPFEKNQIGSSAMAYKRNPMRSERISALSRFIISLPINGSVTAATQWFERTLDDSANRRIVIPQAFLALDAVLNLYMNVTDGLVVYEKVINKHLLEELPFMATETILMECVRLGGDRQELHERIRVHSMEAGKAVKSEGKPNDLIERIKADSAFSAVKDILDDILKPENFIGCAIGQVEDFIDEYVNPLLNRYKDQLGAKGIVNV